MEFLRFGSLIPGSYWGCCAVDIIQNFKYDPDEPASIEVVHGDEGVSLGCFLGKTYKEIFLSRLRIGTFSTGDLPNHAFLAVISAEQLRGGLGKKWLAILKENGFEFIRAIDNSVYSGSSLQGDSYGYDCENCDCEGGCEEREVTDSRNKNYLFGLFRNIGVGAVQDPFAPPPEWLDLPDPYEGKDTREAQVEMYEKIGPPKFYQEDELERDGIPITYAGIKSPYPQQKKEIRLEAKKLEEGKAATKKVSPFFTQDAA